MTQETKLQIVASDAGGTMTDMIVVNEEGEFSIGKAATTPRDESLGFWESLADALEYWDTKLDRDARQILPGVEAVVYSGTGMMNVLLLRAETFGENWLLNAVLLTWNSEPRLEPSSS